MNTKTDVQELREIVASLTQLLSWQGDLLGHATKIVKTLDAGATGNKGGKQAKEGPPRRRKRSK